ncbi:MAG: DUF429 domain-containing protein [Pseudomonadota bacterium]
MPSDAFVHPLLIGVDFTSSPSARKPIVMALGERRADVLSLKQLLRFTDLSAFTDWLAQPGDWLGAFDLPFGLPRELVETLGWPLAWAPLMRHYTALSRAEIRSTFAAFCQGRPVGGKFAHRACDGPAGSSPSMKWVNPPVAYMLHAGVPCLLSAGVDLPHLHPGDPRRVALEGYPGVLAREVLGARSYKSDDRAKQTPERLLARKDLVEALAQGRTRLELRLRLSHAQRDGLAHEGSADALDAVLCLMQAAWSSGRPNHGLPADVDPLEGWVATVS